VLTRRRRSTPAKAVASEAGSSEVGGAHCGAAGGKVGEFGGRAGGEDDAMSAGIEEEFGDATTEMAGSAGDQEGAHGMGR